MKLRRLKLTRHPLLRNLEIQWPTAEKINDIFPMATSLLLLVGENGAGKSSLLAALCDIWGTLYKQAASPFAYELSYQIGDRLIEISCEQAGVPYPQLKGVVGVGDPQLPDALHILTSGNEDIWRHPIHPRPPQIRLVERGHLPIMVLNALLEQTATPAYAKVMALLGLKGLHGFSLAIPKEADNPWPLELGQAVTDLRRHARHDRETPNGIHLFVSPSANLVRDLPPKVLTQALLSLPRQPKVDLLLTRSPQEEEDLPPLLRFCDLSDGERAFLGVMATVRVTQGQDALLLLDEPEVHYNDAWKARIVDCIHGLVDGGRNQILMTSHSSITLTDVPAELISQLKRINGELVAETPSILTLAADPADIMLRVFGSKERTGHFTTNTIRECIEKGEQAPLRKLAEALAPGYWRYRVERALEQFRTHEE